MGGGGSKGYNYSDEMRALEDQMETMNSSLTEAQSALTTMQNRIMEKERNLQVITQNKAQSDCELAGARAELAGLRSSANDKERKLQVITQDKAKSDRELAAAQVELAGLRSSANEKEIILQEMKQNKAKRELELNALRDTIAKDKIRYAEGAMALVRQHDIMMNNIVANSRSGERLNPKKDLVIRILSELRENYYQEMIEWCLDVARDKVCIVKGETILYFFHKRSLELVREIKIIKGLVCTMTMEDELKQKIATHLQSILEPAIDLDDKVRESRFALISDPKSFTLDHIKKCLDMVEEAAWVFPHMRTVEQCVEDEKEKCQQSIDSALLKLSIEDKQDEHKMSEDGQDEQR